MGEGHSPTLIGLNLLSLLVWAAAFVVSTLSGIGGPAADVLFLNRTGATSNYFYVEIAPGSGAFKIWQVIYPWTGLLLLYPLINICRRTKLGPVYVTPPILNHVFFVTYLHCMVFLTAWIFLFDRQFLWMAFIDLFLTTATCIACLAIAARTLHLYGLQLKEQGIWYDAWIMRVLVHNGLGIFGAWCTLATHLNANIVMAYTSPLDVTTASIITAGILAGVLALFYFLDLVFWDRYTRYVITPYLTVLWALAWILQKNWDSEKTSSIIAVVVLAVSGVATLAKLVLLVWRSRTRPLLSRPDSLLPTTESQTNVKL